MFCCFLEIIHLSATIKILCRLCRFNGRSRGNGHSLYGIYYDDSIPMKTVVDPAGSVPHTYYGDDQDDELSDDNAERVTCLRILSK